MDKTCTAPDGTTIAYTAAGSGEPALVFIHGGLANRHFFDGEVEAFTPRHRVIVPDLPGHGDSEPQRGKWGLPEFGAAVARVVEAEDLRRVILFGNSLGGPVAIEAALRLPGKVLGVVGIDTFQRLGFHMTPEQARERAEAFRSDYAGRLKQMVKSLFHPDADPAIVADAEARMANVSPAAAYAMFASFGGYDQVESARRLTVPLRAINGDLYPTDIDEVRSVRPEFEVVVMKHMGHYPMLERPDEFDRIVAEVVTGLTC